MTRRFLFILGCCFFLGLGSVMAWQGNIQVQRFGVEDGLSSRILYAFHQDAKGFMWVGTNYGLNRFDGHQFKVYTKEKYGFSDNRIVKVFSDRKGYIWLSSASLAYQSLHAGNTVDIFDPIKEQNTPLANWVHNPELLADKTVVNIFRDQQKQIYLSTRDGELLRCEHQTLKPFMQFPKQEFVRDVQSGANGNYWILTTKGLYIKSSSQPLTKLKDVGKKWYDRIIVSPKGNYIDYTLGPLFNQNIGYPFQARRLYHDGRDSLRFTIPEDYVTLFQSPDKKQAGVIRSTNKTLGILDFQEDSKGKFYPWNIQTHALNAAKLNYIDKQGGIWIDNAPHGIIRVQHTPKRFRRYLYQRPNRYHQTTATRAITTWQNELIVSSRQELHRLQLAPTSPYQVMDHNVSIPLPSHFLRAFLQLDDQLLIGVNYGTLFNYDLNHPHKSQSILYPNYADSMSIVQKRFFTHWSIFQDQCHRIWLGHMRGISYLENGELHLYTKTNEFEDLNQAFVYQFHENEQGIWVVSTNGLYLLDPERGIIDRFYRDATQQDHQLPNDQFHHLHEDKQGYFWLASKGGGLIKWHPKLKKSEQFTIEDGLSHNVLYAVYEDEYQNLWLSSNRGIMRFHMKSHFVTTFLPEDGITHEEFNRVSHHQAADGNIYFGGLDGVTAFHPKDFQYTATQNSPQTPTLIALKVQNGTSGQWENSTPKAIHTNTLQLAPTDLGFLLEFANLDFRNVKKQQYAYFIQGYDKAWTYQKNRSIRINELPYGQFSLFIKAQDSEGIWGQSLRLDIEVIKPIYLRTWFMLLLVALGLSSIWLFIKWRTHQLEKNKRLLQAEVKKRTQQIEDDKKVILKQREELTKLDKLKSRFFTNLSHELRTPLTLILGPAKHAQETYDTLSAKELKSTLKMIENNGHNLLHLVEEILELAKLEANQIEVNQKAVDFSGLLARIYANFESQAQYLGIHYELENWEGQQAILLDINKVEKIINNLISNALKFTPQGKKIIVKSFQNQKSQLAVQVIDTGKGIHPDDLPHLFERFYQSKQVNGTAAQGGTGIGLALSKELTEVMSGQLKVNSLLGEGSTFTLTLPLLPTEIPATIHQIELPVQQESAKKANLTTTLGHILVVEDNQHMQQYLASLLHEEYELTIAKHGKEALEILANPPKKIDLILSDVMMPEMDGFTLLATLKANKQWAGIPIIMLTARAAESDRLQALRIGVDDYLTKPFSTPELKARIHNLLNNYRERELWQEAIPPTPSQASSPLAEVDQKWLEKLESIMKESLGHHQLTMEDFAEVMHISKRQLSRKLKQLTGLSPLKYQREIQLQIGRELLEKGTYATVAEVAYKAGFKNPHYFSQQFGERFGKKPGEYLKRG